MLIVNIATWSDADFSRRFVLRQQFDGWDSSISFLAANKVEHSGEVWNAVAPSLNIEPGTDGSKWTAINRPGLDLTGCELRWTSRTTPGSGEKKLYLTSGLEGGIQVNSAANGDFTLLIPRGRLEFMAQAIYSHVLVRLRPDALIERLWYGTQDHRIGPGR
jgi:hypothetical protein